MADGIDTSMYGNTYVPQPVNLLGMGYQAAAMANAMNQNKMFQLTLQNRQGMADIAKGSLNPDGSMDYNKFAEGLYLDPRTSMFAPQTVTNLYQQKLLNTQNTTAYIEQRHKMYSIATSMLASILNDPNPTQKTAMGAIAEGLGQGLFDMNTAAAIIKNMPNDTVNPQTGEATNPQIRAYAKSQMATTEQGQKAIQAFAGTWQTITTPGGGTYGGFASPFTSTMTPGVAVPPGQLTTQTNTQTGATRQVPQYQAGGVAGGMPPLVQQGQPDNPTGAIGGQGLMNGGGQPQDQSQGQGVPGTAPGQMTTQQLLSPAQGASAPGVPAQGGGDVNNPGNIRPAGSSTGFNSYPTMGAGVDALSHNLDAYAKQGWTSVNDIVSHWAPSSENDTKTLIANAAKRLGVDPNAKLDLSDSNTKAQVAVAIMQQENGGPKLLQAGGQGQGQDQGTSPWMTGTLPPQAADYLSGKGPVNDYQEMLTARQNTDHQTAYTISEMQKALPYFTAGLGSPERLEAARALKVLGLDGAADKIMGSTGGGVAAAQEFMKLAIPQAITQMTQAAPGGRPNQMLESAFMKNNPTISTDPQAIQKIFDFYTHVMDLHDREKMAFGKWVQAEQGTGFKNGLSLQNFTDYWQDQLKRNGALDFGKAIGY